MVIIAFRMRKKQLIRLIFITLAFLCFGRDSFGQSDDSLARELIKRHIAINIIHPLSPGYRVQLYFGQQRDAAYEMRTDFLRLYPQSGAYVVYQQPNFKLRVGDYRTRLEAQKALHEFQTHYSSAFVVKDDIRLIPDK
ncbi:MAG: Sporulation related domain protein [Bacteroidetes bacterium ADurb.Bin141]|nr:MAG: Sporulation domain-containing protein [Bacteroidetes bacterium OLB10]MBV6453865.1 hypothetical protein [Bacteroidia bacterium]OQB62069.1 MAG: Sporulation related domain protein [Bacteroidetes bacterium ADurb.Bin141]